MTEASKQLKCVLKFEANPCGRGVGWSSFGFRFASGWVSLLASIGAMPPIIQFESNRLGWLFGTLRWTGLGHVGMDINLFGLQFVPLILIHSVDCHETEITLDTIVSKKILWIPT